MGDKDEKDTKQEDVKKEEAEATSAEETNEEKDEYGYDSIVGTKENKIPYSRFKEVNDKGKAAQAELDDLKASMNDQVNEAVKMKMLEDKLLNTEEAPVDDYSQYLDPDNNSAQTKAEVSELKAQIAQLTNQVQEVSAFAEQKALDQDLKVLKKEFPAMNTEHVLAIKKMKPNVSLEEIAKYSNDTFNNHAKETYQAMLEKKKSDAEKKKTVGVERIRNITADEKPKDIKDAKALMLKFMDDD